MPGDNAQESGGVKSFTRWLIIMAMAAGALWGLVSLTCAQDNSTAKTSGLAVEEKEACSRNLKAIYDAIEAYQHDHTDLPNWLSDLVPQYLTDASLLVCPVCRRTGQTEAPPLADPRISSSYLFEFCPVPLGALATNAPTSTRRDWKHRQMNLVGPVIPIVRCRHHKVTLNLAFDGRIYESPPFWETLLTNRLNPADLTPAKMFPAKPKPAASAPEEPAPLRHFAPRGHEAGKQLLDLSAFYNAAFSESWHGGAENDLAALPAGLQKLGGVEFDVRGIVQLRSKSPSSAKYPAAIKGIKVSQRCQHLYFLHAAAFGSVADEGKQIGDYVVHFAANQMRLDIPIRYGHEVRNWHSLIGEPKPSGELNLVWKGENEVSKRVNGSIRLFMTTWTNLAPAVEIKSIDYVASTNIPAPFLVAISVD